MRCRDLVDDQHDQRWLGLLVESSARSGLVVEAGGARMLRIIANGTARVWARIERDNYGYVCLRTSSDESLGAVAPIPFGKARQLEELPEWSRFFVEALSHGAADPIDRGLTFVGPCDASLDDSLGKHRETHRFRAPPAKRLDSLRTLGPCDYAQWNLHEPPPLPLRHLSREDDGRVKAFRKLARDGQLPPVLLFWVAGLERYVVVDGHDRLLASLLEGRAPRCIAIVHVRETKQGQPTLPQRVVDEIVAAAPSTERANAVVRQLFDKRPKLAATTRARVLTKSNAETWRSEVRSELAKLADVDAYDRELLLRG